MVDAQTIGVLVTAASVTVAAIYYMFTLRINMKNQQLAARSQEQTLETRQAQLYMQLYQNNLSRDFLESMRQSFKMDFKGVEDFSKLNDDPETYRNFYIIGMWLEGLGVLVREGLIDIRLVTLLSSGLITWWWDHFGGYVVKVRGEMGFPRYMIEAEYLAGRVVDYNREHPDLGVAPLPMH